MSGHFLIDFFSLTISIFNTLLMIWLGCTVYLNAERRNRGVIMGSAGLLAGAAFFISHTLILSRGASSLIQDFRFWWHVGWLPVIAAPYAWYLMMLWYCGYWEHPVSLLHDRQRAWFDLSIVYTVCLAALVAIANPLPEIAYTAEVQVIRLPAIGGVPIILLVYPVYILLCTVLAFDALLHPAPSGRLMGDLARRRARPWLTGTTIILLVVSLAVSAVFLWLIQEAFSIPTISEIILADATVLSAIDLALETLILAAVIMIGQSIVSYEIFTGKTLPRRGFYRQWQYIVYMAAVLSLIGAASVSADLPQIYILLLILCVLTGSFAWFSQQTYAEREKSIQQMRSIVANQRLVENILGAKDGADPALSSSFTNLCRDVIGVRQAALIPLGSPAALGVQVQLYPPHHPVDLPATAQWIQAFTSSEVIGYPLDPDQNSGFLWVSPLWSEGSLIGLLLLGEKSDGALLAHEEIEIARSSGERLTDLLAGAEMARRLITLQRRRLVESGVSDQHARRVLHDDVLPHLHTLLLKWSSQPSEISPAQQASIDELTQIHRQISALLRELPRSAPPELARQGLVEALKSMLQNELPRCFDQIEWAVSPDVAQRMLSLPALAAEVLYYATREAIRNAAHHARAQASMRPLGLNITITWNAEVEICIRDNGVGISLADEANHGSGQGLALHSALMAVIGGSLSIESTPGEYTQVSLRVPLSAIENLQAEV